MHGSDAQNQNGELFCDQKMKENLSLSLSFLIVALHVFEFTSSFFFILISSKASMELKEQKQQAPLLEVEMQPTHGLLLVELFWLFGGFGLDSTGSTGEYFLILLFFGVGKKTNNIN
jgi:hypothetical protein